MKLKNFLAFYVLRVMSLVFSPCRVLRRRGLKEDIEKGGIKRILVISPSGIGDQILLLPLLRALKERFRSSSIDILIFGNADASIIEMSGLAGEVLRFPFRARGISQMMRYSLSVLRKRRYQMGIHTFHHQGVKYPFLFLVSGVRYALGVNPQLKSFFDTYAFSVSDNEHQVSRNMKLLSPLAAAEPKQAPLRLPGSEPDMTKVMLMGRGSNGNRPVLGMHPGCARGNRLRRWPAERFAAVADEFAESFGGKTLLFIGPDEDDLAASILERASCKPGVFQGQPLKQVVAAIGGCSVFVSNDSGLMHLASAMGVPVVALFGPTTPDTSSPRWGQNKVLYKNLPCSPCHAMGETETTCSRGDVACLAGITVEEVVSAVNDLLAAPGRAGASSGNLPGSRQGGPKRETGARC